MKKINKKFFFLRKLNNQIVNKKSIGKKKRRRLKVEIKAFYNDFRILTFFVSIFLLFRFENNPFDNSMKISKILLDCDLIEFEASYLQIKKKREFLVQFGGVTLAQGASRQRDRTS